MRKLVFASIAILLAVAPAFAVPTIKLTKSTYQSDNGGPFTATVLTEPLAGYGVGDTFLTFCIETDEHFSYGASYYAEIGTAAQDGGSGGPSPDPLGADTAWLYNQYLDNAFTGDLVVDSSTDGGLLQQAVWMLEEEIAMNQNNKYIAYVNAYADWDDIGNIRVMTLWGNSDLTGYKQDQLIRIPTVPAPGAIMLGSIGIAIVGRLRRRGTI